MIHHDGFLTAISEEPEDDAPRLIYADWLEDNGEAERAPRVAVQTSQAGGPILFGSERL